MLAQNRLRAARDGGWSGGRLVPQARCPPYSRRPAMDDDRIAKLYAGQMGIVAVLVNVLIDKGVISQDELRERFEQAHEAAIGCSGGPGIAIVLKDMLTYLEPVRRDS